MWYLEEDFQVFGVHYCFEVLWVNLVSWKEDVYNFLVWEIWGHEGDCQVGDNSYEAINILIMVEILWLVSVWRKGGR